MSTDENRNEHEELNEALEAAKEEAQSANQDSGEGELSEVDALKAQVQELREQMLRSQAEMQNVRRRAEIDVEKAHKFALEKFVKELLPVADSLEKA
ncbi:MAG: nucleotide exchange factor GrpE, partial [Marinobacter sp.]|nr:nucleotide exchange factor GrpE [Marinobacter sp.]